MTSNGAQPMEGIADATSSSIGLTASSAAGSAATAAGASSSTQNGGASSSKSDAPGFQDMTSKDYCAWFRCASLAAGAVALRLLEIWYTDCFGLAADADSYR